MTQPGKSLLRVLRGETLSPPPVWLMRQAGRYLPEYRALRERAGSFLDLCYAPDLAAEATLQPVRRFGLDAAILFSDILVVPHGLGQAVRFEEGEGPRLARLESEADLAKLTLTSLAGNLAPVYEAVALLKARLPVGTALIGFAGAPWTLAAYMIEGGGSRDFLGAKAWIHDRPAAFARLIELLVEASVIHLGAQIAAGAEAVQIFDSWAGILPHDEMLRWSLAPLQAITRRLRLAHPEVPVILFPRGVGAGYLAFAREAGAQGLGLDAAVPPDWAAAQMQDPLALQGNLDPALLLAGGAAMAEAAAAILAALGRGPFIFNLGHGVLPQTPPAHVADLVRLVREERR